MSSQSWTRRPIYSHLIVSFVTVQMVDIASDNPEPAALKTEAGKWHGFPNKIKAEGRQGWVYSLRGKMIRGTANMNKRICCRETPVNNARVSIPNFVTSSCDSFIGSAMLECEQLNQMTLLIISQHFFFLVHWLAVPLPEIYPGISWQQLSCVFDSIEFLLVPTMPGTL